MRSTGILGQVVAAMAAVLLAGCSQQARETPATAVLDDFELDPAWSLDSANDYAALSFVEHDVTSGKLALGVAFADNGRDKAVLRKEVDLDCSGVERLLIDALNPSAQPVRLGLALRAKDGSLFETEPRELASG